MRYKALKFGWLLLWLSMSLKVKSNGAVGLSIYEFLLVPNNNHMSISPCLVGDTCTCTWKFSPYLVSLGRNFEKKMVLWWYIFYALHITVERFLHLNLYNQIYLIRAFFWVCVCQFTVTRKGHQRRHFIELYFENSGMIPVFYFSIIVLR